MDTRASTSALSPAGALRGFTLVELLITIALLTIVMAIAIPRLNTGRSHVVNQAREFKSALNFARSEALNRSRIVTLCPSDDAAAAAPVCGESWHNGWVIYIDVNNDGDADDGEVLRRHLALKGGVSISPNPAVSRIRFDNQGFTADASDFLFCSDADKTSGRTVMLARSGRAMRSKDVTVCP
jgi:prepilin-type N-terminal cleavage/methylation domain-containing protein